MKRIKLNLLGQVFGRLTVISEAEKINKRIAWNCQCECGKMAIVLTENLRCGKTKSCGCLFKDQLQARNANNIFGRKYSDPMIASAKAIWRQTYSDGCSFEKFMELSQEPCHYCGLLASESNKYNSYINNNGNLITRSVTINWAMGALFKYNGLDRICSHKKKHLPENLHASCWDCNRAKRKLTYEQFITYINSLIIQRNKNLDINEYRESSLLIDTDKLHIENLYRYKSTVTAVYREEYSNGDLTLDQFYRLSQLDCYYCGIAPSNKKSPSVRKHLLEQAKLTGSFIYNGIDRISSSLPHNYSNSITSCKCCNFAKRTLSIDSWFVWIDRLVKKHSGRHNSC